MAEEHTGDVGALFPGVELAEDPRRDEIAEALEPPQEAEAVEAAPEPQEPEIVAQEASEEAEEPSEEEPAPQELSEAEILAEVSRHFTPQAQEAQPPPGLTREDLDRALDARLAQMAQPEEKKEEPSADAELRAFQSLYAQASAEEQPQLLTEFLRLRDQKTQDVVEARIGRVEQQRQQQVEDAQRLQVFQANVDAGLRAAMSNEANPMMKAVVEEFVQSGDYARFRTTGQTSGNSMLAQTLNSAPQYSALGIMNAVAAATVWVQEGYQKMQQNGGGQPQASGEQVATPAQTAVTRTTAMPSTASPEPKKTTRKTVEQDYADSILAAGKQTEKDLPFMDWQPQSRSR